MYYTYILKSLDNKHYYVGQTDNLGKRLSLHNTGKSRYTSMYMPWKIHYFEKFQIKGDAVKRERYFKSHAGRNWLKKHMGP